MLPLRPLLGLACLALITSACGGEPPPEPPSDPGPAVVFPLTLGTAAERPAEVRGPDDTTLYGEPLPVVFILHGFSASGLIQEEIVFRFSRRIEQDRFLLVLPEGTETADGLPFWNATPACCGDDPTVDDVGYLIGLVDELAEHAPVDPDRVYFTGHSNGGFMSYRMACEHPDRIAAIMPLAGSTFDTPQECAVGAPVSVLHVHGTLDSSVPYEGNDEYPGALAAAARWAERAGCDPDAASAGTPLDLMTSLEGAETEVLEFREGCQGGKSVDLWTLVDGGHVPAFTEAFADEVLPWLLERSL